MALLKACPQCGRTWPPTWKLCACGQDLSDVTPDEPASQDRGSPALLLVGIAGILILAMTGYGIWKMIARPISVASQYSKMSEPSGGGRVVQLKGDTIGLEGGRKSNPVAIVATSKQSLHEMMRCIASGDVNSFFGVVRSGYGTLVPAGTQAQILSYDSVGGSSVVEVKILEGDLSGRTVWTHSFFVP
jgi:hypothetical protein